MSPYRAQEPECERFEREELIRLQQGLGLGEHGRSCPSCVSLADRYRRLEQAIGGMDDQRAPAAGWEDKVRARILNDRPRPTRRRSRRGLAIGLIAFGALASGGVGAYMVASSGAPTPPTPPPPTPTPPTPPTPPPARPDRIPEMTEQSNPDVGPNVPPPPRRPPVQPRRQRPGSCGYGDHGVESGGHCYMLFNTAETYEAAQEVCAMLPKGAHLATISDQRENSVVQQLAAHAAPSVYGWSDAYIGLDDLTTAGTYAWKTGEPVAYTRWSPGEPNHGAQAGNEHCAVIKGSTVEGAWDDRPCTLAYPFICER